MTTPADFLLRSLRDFEMSKITRVVDIDADGTKSEWFKVELLNPNGMGNVGDNLPMTVEMTIRPRDLPAFAGVMLWDVAEMYLAATLEVQGAGLK